jgi:hypothetical protein
MRSTVKAFHRPLARCQTEDSERQSRKQTNGIPHGYMEDTHLPLQKVSHFAAEPQAHHKLPPLMTINVPQR